MTRAAASRAAAAACAWAVVDVATVAAFAAATSHLVGAPADVAPRLRPAATSTPVGGVTCVVDQPAPSPTVADPTAVQLEDHVNRPSILGEKP